MGEDFSRIWRRVFLAFCRALFAGPLQNRWLWEAVGSFCERAASGSHEEAFVDWAALEADRERKCEGDGSRAALPLSLPLMAL